MVVYMCVLKEWAKTESEERKRENGKVIDKREREREREREGNGRKNSFIFFCF